jgi:NTP pyrophosphatase (non-canonical NTP hydrolase)
MAASPMTLDELQSLIRRMYQAKDAARGVDGTFMWFAAEVGELAEALRAGSAEDRLGEFADVLAWLVTLANITGVDLTQAVAAKYGHGCPGCQRFECVCPIGGKP